VMVLYQGISVVNPLLLWGVSAVAVPVVIHLLSKRRFKVINWAAMEFLIGAHKRNRRRIRMEHLILLLLRCLIVILISLLVARLLVGGDLLGGSRVEYVFVLDDSPSMGARSDGGSGDGGDGESVFEKAVDLLIEYARDMSGHRGGDMFTLYVMSDLERAMVEGIYFDEIEEIVDGLKELSVSDVSGEYEEVLRDLMMNDEKDDGLSGEVVSRKVYVLSDMRKWNWEECGGEWMKGARGMIVDVGNDETANVGVASVKMEDRGSIVGVGTRFDVKVVNYSEEEVRDVEVRFIVEDTLIMTREVGVLRGDEELVVPFVFTFYEAGVKGIRVEIELGANNLLVVDDVCYYAVDVSEGIGVLLVDGDASEEFGESETFFLRRALEPGGEVKSGNVVNVVDEEGFGGIDLEQYSVIVLANVYRIEDEQMKVLTRWIEKGGGLIMGLGDEIDAEVFNKQWCEGNDAVLPVRLADVVEVDGKGELEEEWAGIGEFDVNHWAMGMFTGRGSSMLKRIKFSRWWRIEEVGEGDLGEGELERMNVVARLDDEGKGSVFVVDCGYGRGEIFVLASSLDREWSNWVTEPGYVVMMNEMVAELGGDSGDEPNISVGEEFIFRLDTSRYRYEAKLHRQGEDEKTVLIARESDGEMEEGGSDGRGMIFRYEDTRVRGIYELMLDRYDGFEERELFAVNIDAGESDLSRIDVGELSKRLGDEGIDIVRRDSLRGGGIEGGELIGGVELWRVLVVVLVGVLFIEQIAGWAFGRRSGSATI